MEKVVSIPIAITAIGTIIPILAYFYPDSFGIPKVSINFLTVFSPAIAAVIGLAYFLLTDISLIAKKSRKSWKTILSY
jgi:hypothetical protein